MTARFLDRLHRDERGQIMPIVMFGMIGLALLVLMVFNTGASVVDRMKAQNGADALAISQAAWVARSLNVMSVNNVALTQMMTVGVVSATLVQTLLELGYRANGVIQWIESWKARCTILIWPPAIKGCRSAHDAHKWAAFTALGWVGYVETAYRPDHGVTTSVRTVRALNAMNDHLVGHFPEFSGRIARTIATGNGIDAFYFHPPCEKGSGTCRGGDDEGTDLPLERGLAARAVAFKDMCDAAERGSDGTGRKNFDILGFPRNKGPYTGGGSGEDPHLKDFVNDETGMDTILPLFHDYYAWVPLLPWFVWAPKSSRENYPEDQSGRTNDFTRKMDRNWRAVCPGGGLIGGLVNVLPAPYWIKGKSLIAGLTGSPIVDELLSRKEDLSLVAFAWREKSRRITPSRFSEPFGGAYGYAQAMVFNPTSMDLYTSDWQARLTPAELLDKPDKVVAGLRERAPSAFAGARAVMEGIQGDTEWRKANAH